MGLLDSILGPGTFSQGGLGVGATPTSPTVEPRRNMLGGIFAFENPQTLMAWQLINNGQRPPGEMFTGVPQIAAYGQKMRAEQQEKTQTQQARNRTAEWLATHAPDLSELVKSGALTPAQAFTEYTQQQRDAQEEARWRSRTDYEHQLQVNDPAYQARVELTNAQIEQARQKVDPYADRTAVADRLGLEAGDPRRVEFIGTGDFPRTAAPPRPSATELKERWASEDEIPLYDSTIDALKRAKELNSKTFTGVGAGIRASLGTSEIPGMGYLVDEEKAKATSEFGKLMSMEAIQQMAQTLKGATTDQELRQFVDILADPSAPPDIRTRTIDRMLQLAEQQRSLKLERVQELRGSPGYAPASAGIDALTDEELEAIANGR